MTLAIVHLADLHVGGNDVSEFVKRRDALVADLTALGIDHSILVVSGDVAFSGKPEQYDIAVGNFFHPLSDALDLSPESIQVCPGNHDIDRGVIAGIVRAGVASQLDDTETAKSLLGHPNWIRPQQQGYLDFLEAIGQDSADTYHARTLVIDGVTVGIACFDSAWLCLDDDSKQRIFLTGTQVGALAGEVAHCDLKIAVLHHPLTWFHPSEVPVVQSDLRSGFDMILTGHLHHPGSSSTLTPTADCFEFTVPSFFAGSTRGELDGYNIYLVDPSGGTLSAKYRKLIRARSSYDRNVEHAPNGEFDFKLPSSAFVRQVSKSLTRKLETAQDAVAKRMGESLSRLQRIEPPVVVSPVLHEVHWKDGMKQEARLRITYECTAGSACVLFAPPGVGSTIFLEDLCTRINRQRDGRTAFYVSYREISGATDSTERLRSRLARRAGLKPEYLESGSLVLVVDDMDSTDPEALQTILSLEGPQSTVVCVKNEVLFDAASTAVTDGEIAFLRLGYWGPSRLREFANGYITASGMSVDIDAAVKFIWDSLSLSDLPVTPVLVTLYLQTFLEFGGELSSLSFIRLLERLEQASLDQAQPTSSYSIYNLGLMLRKLAASAYERGDFGVPRAIFETEILEFFSARALDVDPGRFIQHLESSRLVLIDPSGNLCFTSVVFFNYYLSQAIDSGEVDLDDHLQGLHTALRLGDSLAYYAGQHRDQEKLASELLRCLEGEYAVDAQTTSEDLEQYILHLLNPGHEQTEKDDVASEALGSTVDYDHADEEFERDQQNARLVGKSRLQIVPGEDEVEKIAWNIMALKTFYNVFRNLEHIPADTKLALLDRILDHHLQCNMALIRLMSRGMNDEQFTSLCGYMVTISGEAFLSKNVGSASLKRTIDALLVSTKNDLKQFLLHCIYADLRLPGYAGRLESFLSETESPSLLEMGFSKVYELLVRYEGKALPTELVSAFNTAFDKRQHLYGRLDPINLQQLRDKVLNEAKKQFLQARKERVVE